MKTLKTDVQKHIGPGKKIVSIYADMDFHQRAAARAKGLGISLSKYLERLALNDIAKGGALEIVPAADAMGSIPTTETPPMPDNSGVNKKAQKIGPKLTRAGKRKVTGQTKAIRDQLKAELAKEGERAKSEAEGTPEGKPHKAQG